jgi:cytochrome c-type biogenesis protein CcmE
MSAPLKTRHKRLILLLVALGLLAVATALVLSAFRKNLVFFITPTQIQSGEAPHGRPFRIGGLVEDGSLQRQADGVTVSFVVTDTVNKVRVTYRGILPDLFKEGKGVVAQGKLGAAGEVVADQVLAKHDENYMPPDASYALRQANLQALKAVVASETKETK